MLSSLSLSLKYRLLSTTHKSTPSCPNSIYLQNPFPVSKSSFMLPQMDEGSHFGRCWHCLGANVVVFPQIFDAICAAFLFLTSIPSVSCNSWAQGLISFWSLSSVNISFVCLFGEVRSFGTSGTEMWGPSWVMKRWASARCCEATLLYFQISFPVHAPLPTLSKLASLFKFPSSAAVLNFGCLNGMINSPSFRSQLSTGCHLKQLRAVAPLSWGKNDF